MRRANETRFDKSDWQLTNTTESPRSLFLYIFILQAFFNKRSNLVAYFWPILKVFTNFLVAFLTN